jgi:hypothetical protein
MESRPPAESTMDQLAINEQPKPHIYKGLIALGLILPKLTSNAVTVESLLRYNKPGYFFPHKDDLRPYIRDPRVLNAPNNYAYELLRDYIKGNKDLIMPFDSCPDRDYLQSITFVVDPTNRLKLLTEHHDIAEVIHHFRRGNQIVDFVEPSVHNQMQRLYDKTFNKYLKIGNKIRNYAAMLEENIATLKEQRRIAVEVVNILTPERKATILGEDHLKILFEDHPKDQLSQVIKRYPMQKQYYTLFKEQRYKEMATALVNVTQGITDKVTPESLENIITKENFESFMGDLHKHRKSVLNPAPAEDELEARSVASNSSRVGMYNIANVHQEGHLENIPSPDNLSGDEFEAVDQLEEHDSPQVSVHGEEQQHSMPIESSQSQVMNLADNPTNHQIRYPTGDELLILQENRERSEPQHQISNVSAANINQLMSEALQRNQEVASNRRRSPQPSMSRSEETLPNVTSANEIDPAREYIQTPFKASDIPTTNPTTQVQANEKDTEMIIDEQSPNDDENNTTQNMPEASRQLFTESNPQHLPVINQEQMDIEAESKKEENSERFNLSSHGSLLTDPVITIPPAPFLPPAAFKKPKTPIESVSGSVKKAVSELKISDKSIRSSKSDSSKKGGSDKKGDTLLRKKK